MTRAGKGMVYVAWGLALAMLTLLFSDVLEKDRNPNPGPNAVLGKDGSLQVSLRRNRAGHYVAAGLINEQPVIFLLDTGATDVAVPEAVANRIGLRKGRRSISRTAAGDVQTWSTLLRSVDLGGIRLHGVRATILPDMLGEQVLLGMSYLKRLNLLQRDGVLTLSLPGD